MALVVYDSKAIIPAPLITISKVYRTSGDGRKHGVLYNISLAGTLLPFRGSPSGSYPLGDPSNAFWTLSGSPPDEVFVGSGDAQFVSIQRKQGALRWLFREDGKQLEWFGGAASPVKCRPKVLSINFPAGQWVDRCPYEINLEAEFLTGIIDEDSFDASGIDSVSEQWQFNEVPGHDGKVYEITHSVSAKGEMTFDVVTGDETDAWRNAKDWVNARVDGTPDITFVSFATGFTNWVNGGYIKSTNVAERDGSYSITEIWTIREAGPGETAATFFEQSFTVVHKEENSSVDVSYVGIIVGLEEQERTGGSSALSNAKAAMPTNSQAKATAETALGTMLEGFVIPTSPTQKTITVNEKDAVVNFTFNWFASEDADFTQDIEATLSFNSGDGVHNLTLNVNIDGIGDTTAERIDNARSNIPSDAAARTLAVALIGSQKPAGITFTGVHIAKSSALNEVQGSSRTTWTWVDRDDNNVEITVDITHPQTISAKLTIPGRLSGPIIQRMNTKTAEQITVNYSSEGHTVKPDKDTIADTMDVAGEIPLIDQFIVGSYILELDKEVWTPSTGKYTRTRTHTVTEG